MAKNQNKKKAEKIRHKRRISFMPFVLLLLFAIGAFFGWMYVNASITHLKYAQVYLEDLPAQFEGTQILFVSDLNIRNASDSAACKKVFNKLKRLNADMLILGGDYCADTLLNTLNGGNGNGGAAYAAEFLETLHDFNAPLGKYAVCGESDTDTIENAFALAGVEYLSDACANVEKDGAQLYIVGLSDISAQRTPYEKIGAYFNSDTCVIAISHNPSAYIGIRVAEAKNGGAWADMILSGHTLGGQIKLFGKTIRSFSEEESSRLGGWYYTDDLPLLVSQGLGCKETKLRYNTESEIWCITLHRPQSQGVFLPKL